MARKKQKSLSVATNSNNIINNNVNNDISNTDMSPDKFLETYSNTLYSLLRKINNNQGYYPHYSNSLMKDINISPYKPTSQEIEKWLLQPHRYEQQLSNLSQYLEGVVMQYERVVYHFASNLDFYYYIYPITPVPNPKNDKKAFTVYKKSKKKALDFLTKLRIQEQFFNITLGVIREGGKFYYLRESDGFIDYQEMPANDKCIINGRTSLGYTYAFDMTFFLRVPQSLNDYASEFTGWFEDFYEEIKNSQVYYKQMPPEKSVVFLFDDTKAARLNPLRGLFTDILGIQSYKELLRTKTMLDTFKMIYLKAPVDKDGKPSLSQNLIAAWTATASASLPFGTFVFSSPMEASEIKVSDNQSVNSLASIVSNRVWESAGISPLAYGSSDGKSVAAIKASNISDMNFINHLYRQYMKNINYQLSQRTGNTHRFAIKMFGDAFSRQETSDRYKNSAAMGVCKKEYLASLGKLPEEYEIQMSDEELYLWDTQAFIPFATSYTQSGDDPNNLGGRPLMSDDQLGDAGDITKSAGSNEGKVTS